MRGGGDILMTRGHWKVVASGTDELRLQGTLKCAASPCSFWKAATDALDTAPDSQSLGQHYRCSFAAIDVTAEQLYLENRC